MEQIKITLFKDEVTKEQPSMLIEFSTGETLVVSDKHLNGLCYDMRAAISNVLHQHNSDIFKELSDE